MTEDQFTVVLSAPVPGMWYGAKWISNLTKAQAGEVRDFAGSKFLSIEPYKEPGVSNG